MIFVAVVIAFFIAFAFAGLIFAAVVNIKIKEGDPNNLKPLMRVALVFFGFWALLIVLVFFGRLLMLAG